MLLFQSTKKIPLLILITLYLICFNSNANNDNRYNYKLVKKSIKVQLKASCEAINYDSLGKQMHLLLSDKIFPFWYGTKWDFNGITEIPQSGSIACGYFVSTTLKHLGFQLNRYHLAQHSAEGLIKTLTPDSLIHTTYDMEELLDYIKQREDQIYLIGLSNHVGYIEKRGPQVSFIHSNYIDAQGVVKEEAASSSALEASSIFMVATISKNERLIHQWIQGQEIMVKRPW